MSLDKPCNGAHIISYQSIHFISKEALIMSVLISKKSFILHSKQNFVKLMKLIDSLTEKEFFTPFDFSKDFAKKDAHWNRDKNLRDILAHLLEWQKIHMNWIKSNMGGILLPFLPEPYTWTDYTGLNVDIWEKYQTMPYEVAYKELTHSHELIMRMFETFSEEELFKKDVFTWAEGRALIGKFDGIIKSHYEWAIDKILEHQKNCI